MLADGAVAWLDVPLTSGDRPRARRRPAAAGRRSCTDGSAICASAAGLRPGARPGRRDPADSRSRRTAARLDRVLADMRYLILSDIHANLEALEATLAAAGECDARARARRSGRLRRRPQRRHRARAVAAQRHHHPRQSRQGRRRRRDRRSFNHLARHAISWTAAELTPDNRQWLAAHAGRSGAHRRAASRSATARRSTRTSTSSTTSTRAARVDPSQRPVCLFGHTHVPAAFK